MFGRMCRKMIFHPGTPMNRAAAMNSRSFNDCVRPRTTRAVSIHVNAASSTTKISQVLPWNSGDRIAMIRKAGRISSRSIRMTTSPVDPAAEVSGERAEHRRGAGRQQRADQADEQRLLQAAHGQRVHVEPICVVPNQCVPDGGWSSAVGSRSSVRSTW